MIKRACELNKSPIISTDEDPGLRIESFAVINLRGVSTNKTIIVFNLLLDLSDNDTVSPLTNFCCCRLGKRNGLFCDVKHHVAVLGWNTIVVR